ncbi:glycosyltransferase [Microbacterium sp. NPDC055357]
MPEPDVDHIIAVHDLRRPIARAVSSVLGGTRSAVRVTVVCHNVPAEDVSVALGRHADDERLRLLALADDIPSPSGPFNLGLEQSTARYTSIMGSDDELEPGAIDSWLACADRTSADVVIPRLSVVGRGPVVTPPVRIGRRRALQGVADRLAYRSAPLGLVSRRRFGDLRFPPALASGEDVEYSTRLWFSSARISFDRRGPAYLVHEDAPTRVTTVSKPVSADASFLEGLLSSDAFAALSAPQRDALMTKILRNNVIQWILIRPEPDLWSDDDVRVIGETVQRCAAVAPRALRPLSRTDREILDAFTSAPPRLAHGLSLLPHRTAIRPRNLATRDLRFVLAREAPARFGVASRVLARGA